MAHDQPGRPVARAGPRRPTLLSGTTSDVVSELLPAQSWLIDFGRHALRDLARPER